MINGWTIGVCSWSLQVTSIAELAEFCRDLGNTNVQIACGDPHHAAWQENDAMPAAALASGLHFTGTMIGFPGEDYTTPATIEKTGGFSDPNTRADRLATFDWALQRTKQLGLKDIMCHGGFLPDRGPARVSHLETLAQAATLAQHAGIVLSLETGQETGPSLLAALEELKHPNLKINFDPANMLLYGMGDPIEAVKMLMPYIRSIHLKDALPPTTPGQWGQELPLGRGAVNFPQFLAALQAGSFTGPMCVEREVGTQAERKADIAHGLRYISQLITAC